MNVLERLGIVRKAALPAQARLPEQERVAVATPQTRRSYQLGGPLTLNNPWLLIPQPQNLVLYEQLVKTIPVLSAAIGITCHLVGCPKIESEDELAAEEAMEWWEGLSVNQIQTGGGNWFMGHVYDHLLYGRAHAEILLRADRADIYALQELHTRTVDLRPRASGYGVDLIQRQGLGGLQTPLDPRLILTSVHDIHDDSPQGNSLLCGLEFVSEILEKIWWAEREIWDRFGVPVWEVNYEPPETFSDPTGTKTGLISSAFSGALHDAMESRKQGDVRDMVTVGKVRVAILGADGQQMDIEVPGRALLEQIVAKTHIPPFMLSLNWATTERLSRDQAILLGEYIDGIREHLEAPIMYLFRLRQALVGRPFDFELTWEAPSLIDDVMTADAALKTAQADGAKLKVLREEWTLGIVKNVDVARAMRPDLKDKTDAEVLAACPGLLAEPPAPLLAPPGPDGTPPQDNNPPPPNAGVARLPGKSLSYAEAGWNGNGH